MLRTVLAFLVILSAPALGFPISENEMRLVVPGSFCTPESSDFLLNRYPEKIPYCSRNVTTYRRDVIKKIFHIPESFWADYQVDHYMPLFLGGSNANDNLEPLSKEVHKTKSIVERVLYRDIKLGKIKRNKAIEQIKEWRVSCAFSSKVACDAFLQPYRIISL